jgi:hypothetical protein
VAALPTGATLSFNEVVGGACGQTNRCQLINRYQKNTHTHTHARQHVWLVFCVSSLEEEASTGSETCRVEKGGECGPSAPKANRTLPPRPVLWPFFGFFASSHHGFVGVPPPPSSSSSSLSSSSPSLRSASCRSSMAATVAFLSARSCCRMSLLSLMAAAFLMWL